MPPLYESYFDNKLAPDVLGFAKKNTVDFDHQGERQKATAIRKALEQNVPLTTAKEWFKGKGRTKDGKKTPEPPASDDGEDTASNTGHAGAVQSLVAPAPLPPPSSSEDLPPLPEALKARILKAHQAWLDANTTGLAELADPAEEVLDALENEAKAINQPEFSKWKFRKGGYGET